MTEPSGVPEAATPRRRGGGPFAGLLERPYVAAFAAGLLLVVLTVLADDRSGSGSGLRSSDGISRLQRSALTQEVLRDLYSVRAPAAVHRAAAETHQVALVAESVVGGVDQSIVPELILDDSAVLATTRAIAEPLEAADLDPRRYVTDDIEANAEVLGIDFAGRAARADERHRDAVSLRALAVAVTFAAVLAIAAGELGRRVQGPLVAVAWVVTLMAVPLAVVAS